MYLVEVILQAMFQLVSIISSASPGREDLRRFLRITKPVVPCLAVGARDCPWT